jgi:hypothetical protein
VLLFSMAMCVAAALITGLAPALDALGAKGNSHYWPVAVGSSAPTKPLTNVRSSVSAAEPRPSGSAHILLATGR